MRVTSTSTYVSMRDGLGYSLARVSKLQEQLGTGRRINNVSDDPVGSTTALRYRSVESSEAARQRTTDDATTWLGATDTALQSTSTTLRRVQELVILAGNASLGVTARSAVKAELLALRDELVGLANTQHAGQAMFGGHADRAITKLEDGSYEFVGDGGAVLRKISDGDPVTVNTDGRKTFGFDGDPEQDLFSVLNRVATAAGEGDQAALDAESVSLKERVTTVLGALGVVGATVNRVDAARQRSLAFVDQVRAERSHIEDLDLAEGIMQLNQARTGYEAALGAVAKSNLPSLASFLR